MKSPKDPLVSAFALLEEVPFCPESWVPMLQALRSATDSSLAQIMAWGDSGRNLPANLWSEPQWKENGKEWLEEGGADPGRNPLVGAGAALGELQSLADWEVMPKEDRDRHPLFGDFYRRKDIPYFCVAKPLIRGRTHWVFATLRGERQGPISSKGRASFERITRATALALQRTEAIKREGALVLRGALDALTIAAFILDPGGRVITASRRGEELVREGTVLGLKNGILVGCRDADTNRLQHAIGACVSRETAAGIPEHAIARLRNMRGEIAGRILALPLPRDRCDIGLGAAVLLIVETRQEPPACTVPQEWGLTRAEAAVAAELIRGARAEQISRDRGVSITTTRSQIKVIYAKAEVKNQPELMALAARMNGMCESASDR
ncbi:MAG TPA: hypothetical protein VMF67_05895 [Rhizomicrobium sp.]|nr:hypothetical protein [Rhizomicrobium sp.]